MKYIGVIDLGEHEFHIIKKDGMFVAVDIVGNVGLIKELYQAESLEELYTIIEMADMEQD